MNDLRELRSNHEIKAESVKYGECVVTIIDDLCHIYSPDGEFLDTVVTDNHTGVRLRHKWVVAPIVSITRPGVGSVSIGRPLVNPTPIERKGKKTVKALMTEEE